MSLRGVKEALLSLVGRGKRQFGDWGEFAEPNDVLDFVNHLND